jgi:hypothetical protein
MMVSAASSERKQWTGEPSLSVRGSGFAERRCRIARRGRPDPDVFCAPDVHRQTSTRATPRAYATRHSRRACTGRCAHTCAHVPVQVMVDGAVANPSQHQAARNYRTMELRDSWLLLGEIQGGSMSRECRLSLRDKGVQRLPMILRASGHGL